MCVYCVQDENGSKEPLCLVDALMKPLVNGKVVNKEINVCSAFIYIDDEIDDVVRVSLSVFEEDVAKHEMIINYCPVCGRKLNKSNRLNGGV